MRLDRLLANQPELSRQQVQRLLAGRHVRVDGEIITDGASDVRVFARVEMDARVIQPGTPARYYMLNKPAGVISATHDPQHRTVLDLLAAPDREQLHLAGRLDGNSTGLMLLTNDGRWSRQLTQPGNGFAKTYEVETARPIDPTCVERFAAGLYFRFENLTTRPAHLELLGPNRARLTLQEGRYHQIKRMFGQFRNPVVALHRTHMGALALDSTLLPGQYRPLTAAEIVSVPTDKM